MIIKKLELCAFGPFKNVEVIDFTKLNEKHLFLLTGDTGCGKTSLFDAICYCLYGGLSNSFGSGSEAKIRSHYADKEVITYVDLEFIIKNKTYRIRRSPTQEIVKKGRIVTKKATVEFISDEKKLDKAVQIKEEVQNLIGLNEAEFKKIVMLPQGDFMKLLLSSSDEKVQIFRQIFQTSMYDDITNELKEITKKAYLEIEDNNLIIKSQFQNLPYEGLEINDATFEFLEKEINFLKKELTKLANEYDLLNNESQQLSSIITSSKKNNEILLQINIANNEVNELKSRNNEYLKWNEILKNLTIKERYDSLVLKNKTLMENITKLSFKLDNSNKDLENNQKKLTEVISEIQLLQDKKEKIDDSIKEKNNLVNELNLFEKKLQYQEKLQDLKRNLSNVLDKKKIIMTEITSKESEKQNLLQEINRIKEEISLKQQLNLEEDLVKNKLLELQKLFEKIEVLNAKKAIYQAQTKVLQEIRWNRVNEEAKKITIEKSLIVDEASKLALLLVDNEPCMVCGSLTHPKKAILENKYTKLDLENQKKMVDQLIKQEQDITNELFILNDYIETFDFEYDIEELQKNNENLNNHLKEISNSKEELLIKEAKLKDFLLLHEKLTTLIEEKTLLLNNLNGEYEKTNSEIIKFQSLEETIKDINVTDYNIKIKDLTTEIESYYFNLEHAYENKNTINMQNTTLMTNLEHFHSEMNNQTKEFEDNKEELENVISLFTIDLLELKKYLKDDIAKKIVDYDNALNKALNSIESLSKLKISEKIVDTANFEEKLAQIKDKLSLLQENRFIVNNKYNMIKVVYDRTILIYNNNVEKISSYQKYYNLSKVASGDNNLKLSFERYILTTYLDEILRYANLYLLKLTNNQYELRRKLHYQGRGNQGLDLEVYDYHSASLRDVKTLSGGESFKASLSLALGLSETVRRKNGNVEINTMFIDEGFGTLDQDSLDKALLVLDELKNDNRVIGIISHVSELKERIYSKICIKKGDYSYIDKIII